MSSSAASGPARARGSSGAPAAGAGPGMGLAAVVAVSAAVAGEPSRKAKVALLADVLRRSGVADGATVSAYLAGVVPQGRLGVGWRTLRAVPPAVSTTRLTLADVTRAFDELAGTAGPGSAARRVGLLTDLLSRATAAEQDFLRRLITGELRQGALDSVMVQALASAADVDEEAVRRAAMFQGSVWGVAEAALSEGRSGLAGFGLRLGTPVLPMLAGSAPDVAAAMGDAGVRVVERKVDGVRVQVHRDRQRIRVFTRSLDDITARLPEVVDRLRRLPGESAIWDGEVIVLRPDGRPEPFQVTGARTASRTDPRVLAARFPLTVWLFDMIQHDGDDLLDDRLEQRRERLTALLADAGATDLLIPGIVTGDPAQAQRFFDQTIAAGHEGVVVKDPAAPYAAGRRGRGWVKVKPRRTADLVVVAVEPGSGRRTGWLSNIHLGARDPATGDFVMVGKTFKGMTDDMLRWQTRRFRELAVAGPDEGWVVALRPEQVVEVAFDTVQASRRYSGGVALRFARVVRYRDDKSAAEADTIGSLRDLL